MVTTTMRFSWQRTSSQSEIWTPPDAAWLGFVDDEEHGGCVIPIMMLYDEHDEDSGDAPRADQCKSLGFFVSGWKRRGKNGSSGRTRTKTPFRKSCAFSNLLKILGRTILRFRTIRLFHVFVGQNLVQNEYWRA